MNFQSNNPALIIIDVQKGLDDEDYYGGNRNNKDAEAKMSLILDLWRIRSFPIFHIQHSSKNLNSPLHISKVGFEIKAEVKPIQGEPVITKSENSAFINTDLLSLTQAQGITEVVLIGLTTNHCVSSTARMGANLGYRTVIISDATAAFDRVGINNEHYDSELIHLTTLASLKDEFAQIITTEELFTMV